MFSTIYIYVRGYVSSIFNFCEVQNMLQELFFTANDVAQIMKVSTQTAYRIIHLLNNELKSRGYVVVAGRISQKYFCEKLYA